MGQGHLYQDTSDADLHNPGGMMATGAADMNGDGFNTSDGINLNSSFISRQDNVVDFDDPRIASLPRILLMGPRRAGKTSIQRVVFHKMSPHETLFRLEATQMLERAVVDHTPLCRFTIWDFPGDHYEYGYGDGNNGTILEGDNDDICFRGLEYRAGCIKQAQQRRKKEIELSRVVMNCAASESMVFILS